MRIPQSSIVEVAKSAYDGKRYRFVQLLSGIRALLIQADPHDEQEPLAAVSASICVGSFQDPKHVPGLAHLLEHMYEVLNATGIADIKLSSKLSGPV